ncbi:Wzz/FepE/Etk N-terminal domain-containing protein [Kineosporia rhizophila]|uniref:Wzz/FepE/Etk N-terminal domain-containing protein n=1 Tax=Kineosporia rhizophila TaxID=84633 RepID=UPI001E623EA0|nr:Wzz/FepE/Etk N-terminal domain-containing protein [Kineosporia rhizophila]
MQDILAARQADGSSAAEEAPSLVNAIVRERWVVLACVVIAALLGIGLSTLQSSKYTTESTIFISAQGDFQPLAEQPQNDVARYIANQAAQITTNTVLNTAIKDTPIAGMTAFELRQALKVTTAEDSSVITVSATDSTAAGAQKMADGVVEAYRKVRKAQITEQLAQFDGPGVTFPDKNAAQGDAAVYGDGVGSVEKADLPEGASSPQPVRNALILALIGLIAGTGYALYTQSFTRRKVGPKEASAIFGAPVLSEVPDRGRISADDAIAAAYSEPGDAYRMAAVGLDYIRGTAPGVFLITAPHDGAGSSLTALNLAAAAADHGRRVFLLNIEDTVRPQSEADQGVLRVPLHDLAQGRIDLGHAVERKAASRAQFGIIRLQVLQPVQGHPVPDVQAILDQLPDDTDLVLIDAPPLPASSASFVLAGQVDAAVVVIDEATTPADLEELQRRCRLAGIPVAGMLVNHIRRPNTTNSRRRQRAAMGSVPGRMYDTSPRGLPIINSNQDSGGGFPALGGDDRGYGGGGQGGGYDQGGSYGGGSRQDDGDLPWNDVTRAGGSGGGRSGRRR